MKARFAGMGSGMFGVGMARCVFLLRPCTLTSSASIPPALTSPFAAAFCATAFACSASCPPSGDACSKRANSSYSSYFFARCSKYSSAP
eukprot:CAMPEP_0115251444 /NCGR_PEP_ID=MMETSP0270-20121206/43632_1 /TAXON_ID=71861 /ORGANISM="Scrippsiella trochoidea, Strain CCMP3099" /LENGTH=88 /DNA_ID=CAMNT_0002666863 /DNA_START=39 /DNA_END=305 /DNA_ORIENTATION=-